MGKLLSSAILGAACLALTASSSTIAALQPVAADAVPAARSPLSIMGWGQIAARNPRFVVFGEDHGTVESPAFFGDVAAELAGEGNRLLIAVELSARGNANLQLAWNGPHEQFAETLTSVWRGRNDGTHSAAMLAMLTRLHALKSEGAPISVVAFNGARDNEQQLRLQTAGSQNGHEAMQAENIVAAADAAMFDYVLVLVGEVHASRTVIDFFGPDHFQPMAMRLARFGTVVSLAMQTGDGTAWQCIGTATGVECGVQRMLGIPYSGEAPHLGMGQLPGQRRAASYDGYYWLGPVSASPPAKP
jgi:hypothetical protein